MPINWILQKVKIMNLDGRASLLLEPDVRSLLDERSIREEDIQQVLHFAESNSQFFMHKATGHHLAYFTPAKVTYWVEYLPQDDGYRIYNAYSHRMKIIVGGYNIPSKKEQVETGWLCAACDLPLQLAVVKLTYLDETFAADLHSCPSCQQVFVSEEQAVVKMAQAERMLEDK
jgi:hypothetical protein